MPEDTTPVQQEMPCQVVPLYRVGDTIIFKFDGNIRARVERYEIEDGCVRLDCRAVLGFLVPYAQVIGVERQE